MHYRWNLFVCFVLLTAAVTACGDADSPQAGATAEGTDLASAFAADNGKEDMARSTRLIDDLALNSRIEGRFDDRTRVYGYVFEAKRGAVVSIGLEATAGAGSWLDEGAPLDTIVALYGPFESVTEPGPQLAVSDDAKTLVAPAIEQRIEADGRYLVAFATWSDPGQGSYQVELGCEGTDFQCRRPDWTRECEAGTVYIQGGKVSGDQTWRSCEVVLLEDTTVDAETTLAIAPGVVVRSNYLGTGSYGNVGLRVRGTLQAAGTPEHPIAFTGLTPRGWSGITLYGPSNHLSNVFVENANVAITLQPGASAEITDVVLQGATIGDQRSEAGVRAQTDVEATFVRALVKGFDVGLDLANAQTLLVEDSVVRENQIGIRVLGTMPVTSCNSARPSVRVWRDPIIRHTDIVENESHGLLVHGSDVLIQVEHSNITGNQNGVVVQGSQLANESHLRNNNIYNNRSRQVLSYHSQGRIDLSQNFWNQISDPALSRSWQIACRGQMTFTGFSPNPVEDAGPRRETLIDPVRQSCWDVVLGD